MQVTSERLRATVQRVVAEQPVTDIHTHLYSPEFGELLLWGVDELLSYHYLIAETLRWIDTPYEAFWELDTRARADLIWRTLFLERSPYSEACRGVLTTLQALGCDLSTRDLDAYRRRLDGLSASEYVDRVFRLANIESVVMTNDPFDGAERNRWLDGVHIDPRFAAVLRLDPLLNDYSGAVPKLTRWGYNVSAELNDDDVAQVSRFLEDWIARMRPVYMAVSLPADFRYPEHSSRAKLIEQCILPVTRKHNLPFAMMIGVKRGVNPALESAGDGVGLADIAAVEAICAANPGNKFLVTMLARENQHELCVAARKFRNLMVFGCWWFMNNPSLIEEVTRMRFELLGPSVIPQHSDARILDQLIYKWSHSKRIIADVLVEKYADVAASGWALSEDEIRRDVAGLFGGNFKQFLARRLP